MKNLNINAFKKPITYALINNLSEQTCSTLSNMLALDYLVRLQNEGIIEEYIDNCITKLKKFLHYKMIIDNSFSMTLTLFIVAISTEDINFQDKNNILSQDKGQDTVVEAMVNMQFSEHPIEEQVQIRSILKDLINQSTNSDILNLLNNDPKLLKKIVSDTLKSKENRHKFNNEELLNLNKILQKKLSLDDKIKSFKQNTASLITIFSTLAVAATAVVTGGAALPLLIIPTAILSLKFAPRLSEKVADTILNHDKEINEEKNYISKVKHEIINKQVEIDAKHKQPVQNVNQSMSRRHDVFKSKSAELSHIKEKLSSINSEGSKKSVSNKENATLKKKNDFKRRM